MYDKISNKFNKYKSYGHSNITAFILCIPIETWLSCGLIVGIIIGLSY